MSAIIRKPIGESVGPNSVNAEVWPPLQWMVILLCYLPLACISSLSNFINSFLHLFTVMSRQCVRCCNKLICVDYRTILCFCHEYLACQFSSCNLTAGCNKVFMPLMHRGCAVRVLTVICPEYI
jgi:hypothetical protein